MPQTIHVGARSLFVTATAWLFIVLGVVATASALLQQASLLSFAPGLGLPGGAPLLPVTGWLLAYLPWVTGAGLLLAIVMLVSAIGLLLRFELARRLFIGVLVLAIVANVAGLWLQHELVESLVTGTLGRSPIPAAAQQLFGGFVTAARVMGAVVTLLGCGLLAAMIRALTTPRVRQEFA